MSLSTAVTMGTSGHETGRADTGSICSVRGANHEFVVSAMVNRTLIRPAAVQTALVRGGCQLPWADTIVKLGCSEGMIMRYCHGLIPLNNSPTFSLSRACRAMRHAACVPCFALDQTLDRQTDADAHP